MSDTMEQLYAQWLEARTTELQQAAQALIRADDPEAAFREALNQPAGTTDLIEAFADRIAPEAGPDGPFIPELGRRITREEGQTLMSRWRGPVTPFVPQGSLGESMADALNAANEEFEANEARQREAQRATVNESLHNDNANRHP